MEYVQVFSSGYKPVTSYFQLKTYLSTLPRKIFIMQDSSYGSISISRTT